jgi:hypothetical protein
MESLLGRDLMVRAQGSIEQAIELIKIDCMLVEWNRLPKFSTEEVLRLKDVIALAGCGRSAAE